MVFELNRDGKKSGDNSTANQADKVKQNVDDQQDPHDQHNRLLVAFIGDIGSADKFRQKDKNKSEKNKVKDEPSISADAVYPGFKLEYSLFNKHKTELQKPSEFASNQEYSSYDVQFKRLSDIISARITDAGRQKNFRDSLKDFEDKAMKEGLGKDEVARTFSQVSRLLEAPADGPITRDGYVTLAEQVIKNVKDSLDIDQGRHNTCQTTQLQCLMCECDPSYKAKTVADVAICGGVLTESGVLAKIDDHSLLPDREANEIYTFSGDRNYASQLFQVGAINAYQQSQKLYREIGPDPFYGTPFDRGPNAGAPFYQNKYTPQGSIRYLNGPLARSEDGSERILEQIVRIDHGSAKPIGDENEYVKFSPDILSGDLNKMYEELTGKHRDNFMLAYAKSEAGPGVVTFNSEDGLRRQLERLGPGCPRLIVHIHTGNHPFCDIQQGQRGWHAIGAVRYNPETRRVYVDNSWGSGGDFLKEGIDLDTFYRLTRNPVENRMEDRKANKHKR